MKKEKSPSARLAKLAVERLIKSGLLRAERCDLLIAKIEDGTMNGPDWQLEIDLASQKVAD